MSRLHEQRMKDAVRHAWTIRLTLLALIFIAAWTTLHGRAPWPAGIALLITVVSLFPLMLVPPPGTRMGMRYWIAADGAADGAVDGEMSLKLAAACGAAGDHAEQISILWSLAERRDPEAYRLLLEVLAEHGKPGDVAALRRSCVEGLSKDHPLFTPWPGIDGPGLLGAAQQRRHLDPGDISALRDVAVLLDAMGAPDPAVWRQLIDAGIGGFHLPLARHLAASGRIDEAAEVMRVGPNGKLPRFEEAAEFLREHGLAQQLEEQARTAWSRYGDQGALRALRELLTEQGRLDELAQLPEPRPPASRSGGQRVAWPGAGSTTADLGSSGYSGYSGYSGGYGGC
ncbi:hypothetical protein QLQ12_37460 [Actinoplanes sp. NEAU-A12]|uniref:HEAT repeat domain-containing protein n=1 Tax=Actinoplanes sandaracinus TaxID=3045177 RepID=A0ABT6WX30_9ACTN|nr:hypothetical protein [Actinoplanes sandaracinus]MDI6104296.1 hypothetical protein [Actinoplanes sandaracinus]